MTECARPRAQQRPKFQRVKESPTHAAVVINFSTGGRHTLSLCKWSADVCSSDLMKPKRLPSPPCNPGVRDLVEGKRAWSPPLEKDEIECGFLRSEERRVGKEWG